MKEGIIKFLTSYHTETIIEDHAIDSILEIEVSSMGMRCSIHHLIELQYLATVLSLLVLLQTHFPEVLDFEYGEFDVIGCEIEFPTNQRARLLHQYCVNPYLPRPYALVALGVETAHLARLIYLLHLMGIGIGL